MTDAAPPSQPPLVKHHSERSHSRSNSAASQGAAPSASGVPASSPSPPPTAHCPHVSSLLNLNLIRQRFRSRTFQKAFVADQLECCDCNVHFPKDHLWACLQCTNVDCARCGRHDQHHASKHYKAEKHALAIHLHTRVIWFGHTQHSHSRGSPFVLRCYVCDAEVPDEFDTKQLQGDAIPPQLVRSALDKEDAAAEVEEAGDNAGSMDGDDDSEEPEEITWRTYLNNPNGGVTGLSNLGNTCFFNAGTQALLHCPPLIAFFSELSGSSEERSALAMADAHTAQQRQNQEMRIKLTEDFSTLLRKTWGGRYHLCVPTDLLRDILLLNPFFRGYGQHDSQEYIRCILDNLHEAVKLKVFYEYDLKKQLQQSKEEAVEKEKQEAKREREEQEQKEKDNEASASSSGNNSTGSSSSSTTPKAAAPVVKRYPESSIISSLFQGTLESRVECSNCHHVSTTRDPFYDLSLEIPRDNQLKKIGAERGSDALTPQAKGGFFSGLGNFLGLSTPTLSLETCLHSFCTSDSLLQKDQYKCDACKLKVNATKILSLGTEATLPEVLSIHIKRFSHNSYFGSKIGRHVTFPIENLDMAPFLTEQRSPSEIASAAAAAAAAPAPAKDKKLKSSSSSASASSSSSASSSPALYDLFAIVRHLGSVSGGHYIAYCRSHTTGKWFEFDDKHVTEISEDKVMKIEAYVLFYRRKHKGTALARIMKQIDAVTVHNPNAATAAPAAAAAAASVSPSSTRPYRYVSRYWLKKMEVLGRPEPIDNRDLCCPHGMPKPLPKDGGDRALVITPAGWESLFAEYGGGPIVDSCEGALCEPCQLPLIRKQERARIAAIDTQANRQAADDPFFLIHSPWLQQWRQFVSAGGPRPGPITNHLLFEPDGRTLLPGLARLDHYRALHGLVWSELQLIYGGGPIIKRPTVDIYAAPPTPTDEAAIAQPMDDDDEAEDEQDAESEADEEVEIPASNAAADPAAVSRNARSNSGGTNTAASAAGAQPQSYAYVNQPRQ